MVDGEGHENATRFVKRFGEYPKSLLKCWGGRVTRSVTMGSEMSTPSTEGIRVHRSSTTSVQTLSPDTQGSRVFGVGDDTTTVVDL